jgi:hypothetical protein
MAHTFYCSNKLPLVMPQNWVHLEWTDWMVPLWPMLSICVVYTSGCSPFLTAAHLPHPYNGPWGPRGGVEVCLYSFFNLGAGWGGLSTPCPDFFTPSKETRYTFYRRVGGLQCWSGWVWKILAPPGLNAWTVLPIVSRSHPYIHKYEIQVTRTPGVRSWKTSRESNMRFPLKTMYLLGVRGVITSSYIVYDNTISGHTELLSI